MTKFLGYIKAFITQLQTHKIINSLTSISGKSVTSPVNGSLVSSTCRPTDMHREEPHEYGTRLMAFAERSVRKCANDIPNLRYSDE